MVAKEKIELTKEQYNQKKYEISKDILASILTVEYLENGVEFKRRDNLIFNCLLVTKNLMDELGYTLQGAKTDEGSTVRKLSDIFENKE